MATFADTFAGYKAEMDKLGIAYDEAAFEAVVKGLGPSIYNEDSSRVSCSDQTELDRVKNNYLIGKLGLSDGPELDAAIKEVCEQLGSSNRNKYRGMFYYLLAVKFGKA
ncbi:MAG: DUF2853 family protein [Saprospiraceae bacterium]|nr:DUF2853 family protein [Saprospiraceae bacterium]